MHHPLMPCTAEDLPFQPCPRLALNLSYTDLGSATHALPNIQHRTLTCQPCSESSLVYTALNDLHLLLLADLDTTQSLFMSSFESNYFPLGSGIDSNRYSQKMLQSVVKSKRFLGKTLEPWVYLIHFPKKLKTLEPWVYLIHFPKKLPDF